MLNTYDSDMVGWLAEAAYHEATSPSPISVITNADQGVAVFSPAAYQNGNLVNPQVTYVSGDAVTSQVSLTFNAPPWLAQCSPTCGYQYDGGGVVTFWPQLQRADGSYIGTVGVIYTGGECLTDADPCPSAAIVQEPFNENSATLAAVGTGGVVWQEEYPSSDNPTPILPLYATSDGGTVVTSSQKVLPDLNYGEFSLGTLYTLDQNGNVTWQTADTGAVLSWSGNWYADPPETLSSMALPLIDQLDTSAYWSFIGGRESDTLVAFPACCTPSLEWVFGLPINVAGKPSKPDVVKTFTRSNMSCGKIPSQIITDMETNFPNFADYIGNFGAFGLPAASASVTFSGTVSLGSTISINNLNMFEIPNGTPSGTLVTKSFNVAVKVSSVTPNSFTFATLPGHVLYPATISFSASSASLGNLSFTIAVNGHFANKGAEVGYFAGGSNLEDHIWNNVLDQVQSDCKN